MAYGDGNPDGYGTQPGAGCAARAGDGPQDTGQETFTLYLSPGDAVSVGIQEVGWFAGSAATGVANSGVMVARGLYAHTKLASESIQVDFTLVE